MIVAGAPPPTRTIERIETELGWEFIQIYGLTETSPLLTMNRVGPSTTSCHPPSGRPGSGAPVPRRSACASRSTTRAECWPRSNVVMDGYWNQPDGDGRRRWRDGWFHTGDGGFLDAEGYLTIRDRKKDVIISGGENVSSIEVEDVLFSHPAVAEVAVIGIPHEKWGETVTALVVLAPGASATEPELIAHCREHLAHYKCPTVDRVPRRAGAHGHRQAPEVQAPRSPTGKAATASSTRGLPGVVRQGVVAGLELDAARVGEHRQHRVLADDEGDLDERGRFVASREHGPGRVVDRRIPVELVGRTQQRGLMRRTSRARRARRRGERSPRRRCPRRARTPA